MSCDLPRPTAAPKVTRDDGTSRRVGRTLAGKLHLEECIDEGAMGAIYRAHHLMLDRTVCVKTLRSAVVDTPVVADRFRREAKAAARFDHPSSVRVLDFGTDPDGTLYLVMEYLEGRNLAEVIRTEGPLAPARSVPILSQVLSALSAAHAAGVVHRDVKPDNIMLVSEEIDDDEDGPKTRLRAKLCDFGVAEIQGVAADSRLTMSGFVVGTPDYLAPEQARGAEVDGRADLYSVGVMLFEMLTGRTPFDGDTAITVMHKHLTEPPPRPSDLVPGIPARLDEICLRALAKEPDLRFCSAREMLDALADLDDAPPSEIPISVEAPVSAATALGEELEDDAVIELTQIIRRPRPRSRRFWYLGAAAALALVAGAFAARGEIRAAVANVGLSWGTPAFAEPPHTRPARP